MGKETDNLLKRASSALRNGDKHTARRFASQAAAYNEQDERPWVILGMLASERASLEYFIKAVRINSASKRAKQGLDWSIQRSTNSGLLTKREARKYRSIAKKVAKTGFWRHPLIRASVLSSFILVMGFAMIAADLVPGLRDSMTEYALVAWQGNPEPQPDLSPPTTTSTPLPSVTPTSTLLPTQEPTNTPLPSPTATLEPTAIPPSPTPIVYLPEAVEEGENWIDVDLTKQETTAYQGSVAIRTFIVSTGTYQYPTVTGQYQIYVKYELAPMSGPGYYLPGVPYIMYFYRGYGLHGTYWHNNFGTPMSHGCVNMTIDESRWMYNFAKVGTWVNIHY